MYFNFTVRFDKMVTAKPLEIKKAFEMAQQPHQNHSKLVAVLKSAYNQAGDKTVFFEEFVHFLKYPMVVYQREPTVERVMDFVVKFATSFVQPRKEEDPEEEEESDNPFLNYLFEFLLKSHKANSHAIRFRVCQLINKLLGNLPENAQIDDDLFDRIYEAMLIRLRDKYPNVRIQATLAMARLQDPQDDNCPVINAYIFLLEDDTVPEVRRAVLTCIAPLAKTLPKIVGRTMDIKDSVRKTAYQVLAEKVHVRALSIAQRVKLLQQGLNDRSEYVREVVQKKLLQSWLKLTEGNVLELLHRLDVENCPEVAISALTAMFELSPVHELAEKCTNIDSRKLIPVENLTCENALYWRALCEYLKKKGDEAEEHLERILPETAIFADYLFGFLKNITVLEEEEKSDFARVEAVMTQEFIGQQLIHLVSCLDTAEEGGRKHILSVLQEILVQPSTPTSLTSLLTEKLLSILNDDDRRIQVVAEIISEVREPIVTVDAPADIAEVRSQQVKLAGIKVQLIETKQALEECISSQDFARASELKEKLLKLEDLKAELIKEAEQPELKEMRVEKNDPETMLKCLTMCFELLKQMCVSKGIGPTMNGIIESLIFPSIANVHPAVRNMAVLCLGCCALQNQDFASQHLALLLQISQIDEVKVKINALKAVFDLLLSFGIEFFKPKESSAPEHESDCSNKGDYEPNDEEEKKKTEDAESDPVNSILTLLSNFLDSEISELRTEAAEGFAKLLYSGRLISSKLLSHLILLWYNPVTEEDTRLRHCLGVFFPMYAFADRINQECFADAFLPTLVTLFDAPGSSPLAEVDIANVAELLVDLTRSSGLSHPEKNQFQEFTAHDNMAVRICHQILKDPSAPDVRVYAKALSSLEYSKSTSQELLSLLDECLEEIKDKVCRNALEKAKNLLIGEHNKENFQAGDHSVEQNCENVAAEYRKSVGPGFSGDQNQGSKPPSTVKSKKKGQRKAVSVGRSVTQSRRKARRAMESSSEESDDQELPEPVPDAVPRPSRRAKTEAILKTKMDLTYLLNKETS